jgi:hypothetical protein
MFGFRLFTASDSLSETEELAKKIFGMKRDALMRAKHYVAKGTMPAIFNGKPGISTYITCMREVCEEQHTPLPIRAMLDLSGHEVSGFAFIKEDFDMVEASLSPADQAQLGINEEAA